jgi:GTP cyclohydrolase I
MTTTAQPDQLVDGHQADDVDEVLRRAHDGVRALLQLAGEDPDREGLRRTPARVVAALQDMTSAPGDPAALLGVQFEHVDAGGEVVQLGPISFTSTCEHHLLPFTGHVWIAYQPTDRVVGLSKLARLVEHHARRLQIQERMTQQLVDDLVTHLAPAGAAVTVRATHTCMALRGIRKPGAVMDTAARRGVFRTDPTIHAQHAQFVQTQRP